MSVVIPIGGLNAKFPALWGSFWNYAYNFWFEIDNAFIRGTSVDGIFGVETADKIRAIDQEKFAIYAEWFAWTDTTWPGFKKRWKFYRFLSPAQLQEDWVPPLEWLLGRLPSLALPQEPQHRQRIILPDGSKRSIRVKRQ